MNRWKRVIFTLLAALLLTTSAFADMGPKDQLTVRIIDAPQELYYLDILAQGSPAELHESLSDGERITMDKDLYAALLAAIPEGWHGCLSQGVTGAPINGKLTAWQWEDSTALHWFGYYGLPQTYRLLLVTKSGEVFLSDTFTRQALQSSATIHWAQRSMDTPTLWQGYALQFLSTLLPTLLVEGLLLALFGLWRKKNLRIFFLINLETQGLLAAALAILALQYGVGILHLAVFLAGELFITAIEAIAYIHWFDCTAKKATAYAVTANLTSAILGYFIMEPVWRFVGSIS